MLNFIEAFHIRIIGQKNQNPASVLAFEQRICKRIEARRAGNRYATRLAPGTDKIVSLYSDTTVRGTDHLSVRFIMSIWIMP
jgi:hypothetical protein